MGATLEDLKELELCYSPVFGTAKDVVNQAALVGLNVLYGTFRQVHVDQVPGAGGIPAPLLWMCGSPMSSPPAT